MHLWVPPWHPLVSGPRMLLFLCYDLQSISRDPLCTSSPTPGVAAPPDTVPGFSGLPTVLCGSYGSQNTPVHSVPPSSPTHQAVGPGGHPQLLAVVLGRETFDSSSASPGLSPLARTPFVVVGLYSVFAMWSVLYCDPHNRPALSGLSSSPNQGAEVVASPRWWTWCYDPHNIFSHTGHISSPTQEVVALLQVWVPGH